MAALRLVRLLSAMVFIVRKTSGVLPTLLLLPQAPMDQGQEVSLTGDPGYLSSHTHFRYFYRLNAMALSLLRGTALR